MDGRIAVFGKAISFWWLFLWAIKEKGTRPRQRTKTAPAA